MYACMHVCMYDGGRGEAALVSSSLMSMPLKPIHTLKPMHAYTAYTYTACTYAASIPLKPMHAYTACTYAACTYAASIPLKPIHALCQPLKRRCRRMHAVVRHVGCAWQTDKRTLSIMSYDALGALAKVHL